MTEFETQQLDTPPADSPAGRVKAALGKFKPAIFKFLVGHLLGLAGLLTGILTLSNGELEPALAIPLIVVGAVVELWAVVQFIKAMPKEKCPQCGRRLVQGKINGRTFRNAFRACSNCGADLWQSDGKTIDSEDSFTPAESYAAEDTLKIDDENPYAGQ